MSNKGFYLEGDFEKFLIRGKLNFLADVAETDEGLNKEGNTFSLRRFSAPISMMFCDSI